MRQAGFRFKVMSSPMNVIMLPIIRYISAHCG